MSILAFLNISLNLPEISVTLKKNYIARHWWLMPVILATQQAEIRFVVQSQPG
jgi:hypothetical protein